MSYKDIFAFEQDLLPYNTLTQHKIELKNPKPINVKSYRSPECHKDEIHRQITKCLNKEIIEHSDSPFNATLWGCPRES